LFGLISDVVLLPIYDD